MSNYLYNGVDILNVTNLMLMKWRSFQKPAKLQFAYYQ